eukprot:3395477-Rhodomonas_salina.2
MMQYWTCHPSCVRQYLMRVQSQYRTPPPSCLGRYWASHTKCQYRTWHASCADRAAHPAGTLLGRTGPLGASFLAGAAPGARYPASAPDTAQRTHSSIPGPSTLGAHMVPDM